MSVSSVLAGHGLDVCWMSAPYLLNVAVALVSFVRTMRRRACNRFGVMTGGRNGSCQAGWHDGHGKTRYLLVSVARASVSQSRRQFVKLWSGCALLDSHSWLKSDSFNFSSAAGMVLTSTEKRLPVLDMRMI